MIRTIVICIVFLIMAITSDAQTNPTEKKTDSTDTIKIKIPPPAGQVKPVVLVDSFHVGGLSFDTCCPVVKICCETKLIDEPGTVGADSFTGNKSYHVGTRKYKNYILQKNFADMSPFFFQDFALRYGKSNICIRICNINRLVYKISANGEIIKATLPDTNFFSGLYQTYKAASTLTTTDSAKKAGKEKSIEGGKKDNNDSTAKAVKPGNKPTAYDLLVVSVNKVKAQIDSLGEILKKDLKNLDQFAKFSKNAPVIVGSECCSQQKIKNNLGNEANIREYKYKEPINYSVLGNLITTDVPFVFDDMKEKLKSINDKKAEIKKLVDAYKNNECKKDKQGNVPEACLHADTLENLSKEIVTATDIATKADKDELTKNIKALQELLANVDDDKNFYYTKCFGRADGEFVNISVIATPKDDFKNRLFTDTLAYQVPVVGRFKWAIGPSLNFHIGSSLINNSYSLDSARRGDVANGVIMSDTFKITQNDKRNHIIPYVGFMAHFYWQTHRALTPAIAIGISTSPTQLADLRAYLGGSLIIGGPIKGKVIFTAGLAGAAVDRLKANLQEGLNPKSHIPYNGNNLGSPDQLVEKVFRVGFFFGMTYNLKD